MKTIKIVIATLVGFLVTSCNNSQFKTKKTLDNKVDSISYAVGLNMATQVKANFDEVNHDLFIQGFKNGIDSVKLLLDSEEAPKIIREYFQKKNEERMKKMQEEQAKKAEEEFGEYKKENEKFLEENKTKEGVKTTESGLQYLVLKEGKGEKPKATSKVKVHYHGTLIDGTVFDSSVERKEPLEIFVDKVIKGWTEGLQLMTPGAKYKFFIPSDLAYGATPRTGGKIKPFATLIFEVELLEELK